MASLKVLLSERKSIKCKLTRFKNYFESNQTDDSIPELRERFDRFLPLADKFDEVQSKIEIHTEDSGEDASHETERDNFDKSYYRIVTSVKARLGIGRPQGSLQTGISSQLSSSTESELPVKLPVIQLPTFDGAYGDWIRFRDTFESLIHTNANISVVQKFNYLNSTLKGEAARAIRALGISEGNYAIAWATLKNRYEDPQGLIRYHTKALFDIPPIIKTSARALRELIDDCTNHLKSLNSLREPTQHWDTLIIHLLSTKLDGFTKREWEKVIIKMASNPSLNDMLEFLEGQSKYLAQSGTDRGLSSRPQMRADGFYTTRYQIKTEESHNPRFNKNTVACVGISKTACKICNGDHPVFMCEKFRNSSHSERIDQVARAGICFNCLYPGHKNLNCTRSGCKKCNKKHNTLLHTDGTSYSSQSKSVEPSTSINNTISLAQTNFSTPHQFSHVVLGTAIVLVEDNFGKRHECRALLDPASQASFITTNFCNRLKLTSTQANGIVSGIGQQIGGVSQKTAITLHSRNTEFSSSLSCFIIPKITEDLPNFCINRTKILIPHNIKLADPNFDKTREIDLLISGELFWDLFINEQNRIDRIDPLFRNTKLGWIFAGKLNNAKIRNTPKNLKLACNLVSNDILLSEIKKFWEIEHCYDTSIIVNQHDECERHYQGTTTRDPSGRYIVSIPFNDKLGNLGNSKWLAEKRFYNLERKLNKQPSLKQDYIDFMTEYESLGHMTEISSSIDTHELNYYLPHHAVIKLDSTSTKLRVVFDGSAKTTTGISLNDTQRIGPTVQDELFSILLRFRSHQYVISADVQKMYRQILVTPLQRRFQRILWRIDHSLPLKTYELNTVTYGTASAPFLATRTLQRIGEECASVSPIASRIIMKDFYVDDLLTGSDNFQEALAIKRDISIVLGEAGLELHKWASNDSRISEATHEHSDSITIASDKITKTLGLLWNPHTDTLQFLIKPPEQAKLTKRTILSEIARVFDPLGLIGPTTILAKVFMQQLWQSKFSWDQSLPREFIAKWIQFRDELPELNKFAISRHVICICPNYIELHGFCDASELAYGACIYVKSRDNTGHCEIKLLCAKSRVAPLKKLSLPRLELCSALVLAQLIAKVRSSLNLKINAEYYWSDSMVALAWIRAPSNKWKTFVANRTAEIQNLTCNNWNHVSSGDNPADAISRGLAPNMLLKTNIWWTGPTWLMNDCKHWPRNTINLNDIPETKETTVTLVTTNTSFHLFERYSSLIRLIRVTAYCLRFIRKVKLHHSTQPIITSEQKHVPLLTASEIEDAKMVLLKTSQRQSFAQEIQCLNKEKPISKNSAIQGLNPFIDKRECLRLGGRLSNSQLPYEEKFPLILSSKHPFTKLLIEYEHKRLLHAGTQAVMTSLRRLYWPTQCRTTVKHIIRKCVRCFRVKPITQEHLMGDLPASRVTCQRPFHTCGVDYAGPFLLKDRTRSKVTTKAYLCVFVCFTTKAVHLELAANLTTDAFLNCLRRFIARRGNCHSIYSDNGTNFIGARNELHELGILMADDTFKTTISDHLSTKQIQWHLIPPHAPHFGGLWESAVKSAKYHLKRTIRDAKFTYEELYTLLTQIESCMNSRPLCPLSDDPTDLNPLTPGHFLIGDSLTALPHPDLQHINVNRLNRYQHIQQMLQHFWKRWHQEYFHQLQQRTKWRAKTCPFFGPGTLVLIKEDNAPPLKWKMGRITEVYPGKDNIVRVVSVRTWDGILKRPLTKICILPIADNLDKESLLDGENIPKDRGEEPLTKS